MKQLSLISLFWVLIGLLLSFSRVLAQDSVGITLNLNRDFGYSGGGEIQGTFTLIATASEDLDRVVFMIDDDLLGEDNQAPFRLQFNTGGYNLGLHKLSAIGYTIEGQERHSNEIRANFVTPGEGWQAAVRILLPILAVVILAALLSAVVPVLSGRGKSSSVSLGAPRNYGLSGGTVCPNCRRPYARHWWGMNIVVGKFDRCPHCGKWSLARRAMPWELKAAEAAELELAPRSSSEPGLSEEERLRRELEESRYQDL
jgi:hypothetical protein